MHIIYFTIHVFKYVYKININKIWTDAKTLNVGTKMFHSFCYVYFMEKMVCVNMMV